MRSSIAGLISILLAATTASAQLRTSLALEAALSAEPGARQLVWVYLADKGPDPMARLGSAPLSERAKARRALRGTLNAAATLEDLPLVPAYVDAIRARVTRLRNPSRWLNAVSVEADLPQVRALEQLPFVERMDLVRRYRSDREETIEDAVPLRAASTTLGRAPHSLDYGSGLTQVAQINVPAVHDLGYHGEGVMVALFDTGFDNLAHEAFATMQILARHDFVNGDDDVASGADMGKGSHGTYTLSTIGGYQPGQLIGPAFASTYVLAKTENTQSETPVEEDNWAAAAEWAEALGVDVISSSLGYLDFDGPFTSYTWADMDGAHAITTRAADLAAARGVVVVNSAGNDGFDAEHNTLNAPADGRLVITAGAVDSSGRRADFSSVGPTADGRIKPDVAAQGVTVKVASSAAPSLYGPINGTSFSCPLTAGVAALVLQAHPTYTVSQVASVLRSTASQAAAPDRLLGWGIVNALAAIQAPEPPRE